MKRDTVFERCPFSAPISDQPSPGGENMAEPGALEYFYGTEAEQYTLYRIPKVLFTDPGFKQTTGDAKILYGLLLNRIGISIRNGWLDEQNRFFIIT